MLLCKEQLLTGGIQHPPNPVVSGSSFVCRSQTLPRAAEMSSPVINELFPQMVPGCNSRRLSHVSGDNGGFQLVGRLCLTNTVYYSPRALLRIRIKIKLDTTACSLSALGNGHPSFGKKPPKTKGFHTPHKFLSQKSQVTLIHLVFLPQSRKILTDL